MELFSGKNVAKGISTLSTVALLGAATMRAADATSLETAQGPAADPLTAHEVLKMEQGPFVEHTGVIPEYIEENYQIFTNTLGTVSRTYQSMPVTQRVGGAFIAKPFQSTGAYC